MPDRRGQRGHQGPGAAAPRGPQRPPGTPILPWAPMPPFSHVLQGYLPVLLMFVREAQARRRRRQRRAWQPRVHHLPDNDVSCIQAYRLDRGGVDELLRLLGPRLRPRVTASRNIPALQKILMGLHYLATGSFQVGIAHRHATSQSSASRCVRAFLEAMLDHAGRYLHFSVREAKLRVQREAFYAVAGFPNVIGAVDATHVSIWTPAEAPGLYRNRHHQYSLNVQATCDAQGLFTSVCANFPGSVHDAQIFEASRIMQIVRALPEGTGWLLGDGGYPLRPYLMTPYRGDVQGHRERYNAAHRRTRLVIERAFGLLKMRFRCLHLSGGRLMRTPGMASKAIIACAMLHNLCVRRRTPLPDPDVGQDPMAIPPGPAVPAHRPGPDPRGVAIRDRVATRYFT